MQFLRGMTDIISESLSSERWVGKDGRKFILFSFSNFNRTIDNNTAMSRIPLGGKCQSSRL